MNTFTKKMMENALRVREQLGTIRNDEESLKKRRADLSDSAFQREMRAIAQRKADILSEGRKRSDGLYDAYQTAATKAYQLNPDDVTADAKLLNCGIAMNADDLTAMIARNADNLTMKQLIWRYAKEHKITDIQQEEHTLADELQAAEGIRNLYTSAVDRPAFPEYGSADFWESASDGMGDFE